MNIEISETDHSGGNITNFLERWMSHVAPNTTNIEVQDYSQFCKPFSVNLGTLRAIRGGATVVLDFGDTQLNLFGRSLRTLRKKIRGLPTTPVLVYPTQISVEDPSNFSACGNVHDSFDYTITFNVA